MKYILVVFLITGGCSERAVTGQHGPFDNLIACESAARQAEAVAYGVGVKEVGTFCAGTKDASFKNKGVPK